MIRKVLIANRGEIALRILRACHLYGIKTVAVYTKCDANLLHVRLADEAICIGDNPPHLSYMHIPSILSACELSGADAVHPGYGFLSENADFAEQVVKSGLIFIGPGADIIRKMGDKITAIATMKSLGIPTVPGSNGSLCNNDETTRKLANNIGYPVLIKATGGGGGRGMAVAHSPSSLIETVQQVRQEALATFHNECVYMEKFLQNPRHIEVQVLVDHIGKVYVLGDRDCTLQRRRQKIIEEAPAFDIPEDKRRELHTLCAKACEKLGYESAGTIEFLYEDGKFYFIEMNTRVQVEHPVTEMITGIDIIGSQLLIHSNKCLDFSPNEIVCKGVSIECRINAEHPETFLPSPGKVSVYHPPMGPHVRVDSHLYQSYTIPHYYDSLIAKIITYGEDRATAIKRMQLALNELVIIGVDTNKPLLQTILSSDTFLHKDYSIHSAAKFIATEAQT